MRKERSPEMRLYEWDILRWLTSRTRAELDPIGRYVYRELLDLCYAQGKMPRDHETLARHAGVSPDIFELCWPRMARHFHVAKHDSESLVNDFATVARKNYFKFCAMQAKKRKKRGSDNPIPDSEIHNSGGTTVQPLINQEEIRREEIRREEKIRENNTPTPAQPPPHSTPITADEWPLSTDAVCSEFTATDTPLMLSIVQAAAQACADASIDLTDAILAQAIQAARKQTPQQHNAVLYRITVPKVLTNWAREAKRARG